MKNNNSFEPFLNSEGDIRPSPPRISMWQMLAVTFAFIICLPVYALAQSPELSMREFSSAQIKKGVRTIGMGGDGASQGNYGLVWKDASTAIADYGQTNFDNGNEFRFEAVGVTTPPLWKDLAVYVIGVTQDTNDVNFRVRSPGLGAGKVAVVGTGRNEGFFSKIAMPLGHGVSAGVLLSHEISSFDAMTQSGQRVRYETDWRPSGGFGVAWQANPKLLVGTRVILNTDLERRIDPSGVSEGIARSREFRLGASYSPWTGGLIDYGGTRLHKINALNGTDVTINAPTYGFEQAFYERRFVVRLGRDEHSSTFGFSVKSPPFNIDVAYVDDMGLDRVGDLFGPKSHSLIMTLTWDYQSRLPAH